MYVCVCGVDQPLSPPLEETLVFVLTPTRPLSPSICLHYHQQQHHLNCTPLFLQAKKRLHTGMAEEVDGRPAQYGCTVKELQELMKTRQSEGYQKIQNDYGGVLELCKRLYTSPNEGR